MSAIDLTNAPSLPAETTLGAVRLTVHDLSRSRDFYERIVGLRAGEGEDGTLILSAGDGEPLVVLTGDASAPALDHRRTGLFHLAVLLPSRRDLARALVRIGRGRWPLSGASDHLVSEALYLSDPDGNGIEIYRDRPRTDWPHDNGTLRMATLPLDLEDVLGELGPDDTDTVPAPAGTRIGHVHLQVGDLRGAEAFYRGVLGFDVTVRGYPGALFLSAGGYHHHIGTNTWNSAGAPPPEPGSVGLRAFEVVLPGAADLADALDRVRAHGLEAEDAPHGTLVRDPFGSGVLLRAPVR